MAALRTDIPPRRAHLARGLPTPARFAGVGFVVLCALSAGLGAGCDPDPLPLPTEAALDELADEQQAETSDHPPLYQLLYEDPLLPHSTAAKQRLKMLIWLRHMNLGDAQLSQLADLRQLVIERTEQIAAAERQVAQRYGPEEAEIVDALWERMAAGAPADAPEVVALTERLAGMQRGSERERELLKIRIEGIRAVLQAEEDFLRTLSPRQEALLSDALFFLRNHLDPVGNPENYRALVGTTYEPGQYAVLTRGSSRRARLPLNIGGLWSDEPPVGGGALHDARREVLLYLALLEPGMDEAIAAARTLLAKELDLGLEEDTGSPEEGVALPPEGSPDQPPEAEAGDQGEAAPAGDSAPPGAAPAEAAPPGAAPAP